MTLLHHAFTSLICTLTNQIFEAALSFTILYGLPKSGLKYPYEYLIGPKTIRMSLLEASFETISGVLITSHHPKPKNSQKYIL